MKSLALLSLFVTVTIAAPSLLGDDLGKLNPAAEGEPSELIREKKSPHHPVHHGHSSSYPSEVHFVPVPVKKFGHKKFREPEESFNQQVEDEVCLEKPDGTPCNQQARSDVEILRRDSVDPRLQETKDVVEQLHRDATNARHHSTSAKMSQWKQSDPELEENHKARQDLENIRQNFGNLESMNLHATTIEDADDVNDAQFKMAKSEEARLAQWKNALESIQRNVEVVRTIEDSFRSEDNEEQDTEMKTSASNQQSTQIAVSQKSNKEIDESNQASNIQFHTTKSPSNPEVYNKPGSTKSYDEKKIAVTNQANIDIKANYMGPKQEKTNSFESPRPSHVAKPLDNNFESNSPRQAFEQFDNNQFTNNENAFTMETQFNENGMQMKGSPLNFMSRPLTIPMQNGNIVASEANQHKSFTSGVNSMLETNSQVEEVHDMFGLERHSEKNWNQRENMERGSYGGYGTSQSHISGAGAAIGSATQYSNNYGAKPGAIGIFPNAHVGNCAIPILLSCSPSVASGSLAKPHGYGSSSYGAPAYKSNKDINKRDIKMRSILRNKVKRTPSLNKN